MNTVLIVDGDAGFTAGAQRALEAQGLKVFVHEDAPMDLVRKLRPSVMMVNVELPRSGASGFSICSRVRRDKQLKLTPILLTSENVTEDAFDRHAKTADHADDYALKPLDQDDVVHRILGLLGEAPDAAAEATMIAAPPLSFENEGTTPDLEAPADKPRSAGPPPLPEVKLEPWKPVRYEDMLREAFSGEEPLAPRNPSPDQRMMFLRKRVKFLESRDKGVKEAWETVQSQGREMERQNKAFKSELERRESELIDVKSKLVSEKAKYETFNEEITRIFKQKDHEEKETHARLTALDSEVAELKDDLSLKVQQIEDDARRLRIFQDEVETLQTEHDSANERAESADTELREVKLRLETTETVAGERADEIETLNEKLDALTLEMGALKKSAEEHEAEAISTLKADHKAVLEARDEANAQELAVLDSALESKAAELAQLEADHATAIERLGQLEDAEKELITVKGELAAEREAGDRDRADHKEKIEALAEEHAAEVQKLKEEQRHTLVELEAVADSERVDLLDRLEKATAQGSANVEAAEEAKAAALEELSNQHAAQLNLLQDQQAESAAQFEADFAAEQEQHAEVIADLNKRLAEAEANRGVDEAAHEATIADLRALHSAAMSELEAEHADAVDALNVSHDRALNDVNKAHADEVGRIRALQADKETQRAKDAEALEDEIEEARTKLFERLAELDHARTELSRLEHRAERAESEKAATEQRLHAAIARIDDLELEVEQFSAHDSEIGANLADAERTWQAAEKRAKILESELANMGADLAAKNDAAERKVELLERQLADHQSEARSSKSQAGSLATELGEARGALSAAHARIDELERALDELHETSEEHRVQFEAVQSRLHERDSVAQALNSKLEASQAESHDLKREITIQSERIASLTELRAKESQKHKERQKQLMGRLGQALRTAQTLLERPEVVNSIEDDDVIVEDVDDDDESTIAADLTMADVQTNPAFEARDSRVSFSPQAALPEGTPPVAFAQGELAGSDILDVVIDSIDEEMEEVGLDTDARVSSPFMSGSAPPAHAPSPFTNPRPQAHRPKMGGSAAHDDPFGRAAIREEPDLEDDGYVTEVVRLEELD